MMTTPLKGMRIVFFGTPEFAVPTLASLAEAGADIGAVVTQPPRPGGRGQKTKDSPVKVFAAAQGLRVLEPLTIKDKGFISELKGTSPELIVVVAYGKILPRAILEMPRLGCVNVHASLLPSYRGAAPINWAIINGEEETGVTTMLMDEGMDTGPMLLKEAVRIEPAECAGALSKRLSELGASLLVRTVTGLRDNTIEPKAQDEVVASYAPLLKKADGLMDWRRSAVDMERRLRGLYPWPGAYTYLDGALIKVHMAQALPKEAGGLEGEAPRPGLVASATEDGIVVECATGSFLISELQAEGKRRISAAEFIRGKEIEGKTFAGKAKEREGKARQDL